MYSSVSDDVHHRTAKTFACLLFPKTNIHLILIKTNSLQKGTAHFHFNNATTLNLIFISWKQSFRVHGNIDHSRLYL